MSRKEYFVCNAVISHTKTYGIKMRKTNSILCLLLSAIQLGTISCSNQIDENAVTDHIADKVTSESINSSEILYSDLPTNDFGNAEFKMLSEENTTWAIIQMTADEQNGEIINDTIWAIDRTVEDRLNVKISSEFVQNAETVNARIRQAVLAGEDEYSVYNNTVSVTAPLILEGYFRELEELPYINKNKPWWDKNLCSSMSFNDKCYSFIGDLSVMSYECRYVIHINNTMANNLTLTDRYQTVRDGKWTLDQLYNDTKLAYSDLNGNGTVEFGDRGGICSNLRAMSYFMIAGNENIYTDNNGLPEFNGLSERATEMYSNILNKLFLNESAMIAGMAFPDGKNWTSAFTDGISLYLFEPLGSMRGFNTTDFDYGLLPIPKYDESQDEYIVPIIHFVHSNFVTKVANDPDMISTVLENLSAESYKTLRSVYFDKILEGKRSQDEGTLDMLDLIFSSETILNQAVVFDWGGLTSMINSNARDKNENIVSIIASNLPVIQNAINDTVEFYR